MIYFVLLVNDFMLPVNAPSMFLLMNRSMPKIGCEPNPQYRLEKLKE